MPSETEWRAEIARLEDLLERSENHVRELQEGIAQIVYNLKERQPSPRNASVTYVSGYVRAMDDMRRTILEIVAKESVTQARLAKVNFTKEVKEHIEAEVTIRAITIEGEEQ